MATRLRPQITKVALVDAGANPDADFVFYKAAEPTEPTEVNDVATEVQKNLDEATARIAELEAERAALDAMSNDDLAALKGFEIAKADEAEEVLKGLPEDVAKRLIDAETEIAKMRAESRVAEFKKSAAERFAKVGDTDEIGEALAAIDSDDVRAKVEKALASANERIDMSVVLKTVGTDGDAPAQTAAEEIAKRAEATKAEGESLADAKMRVIREDRDLQVRWEQERATV